MNTVPFGVKRPKNDDIANIVEQERERIQMGEEPRHAPMSKKAIKSIFKTAMFKDRVCIQN